MRLTDRKKQILRIIGEYPTGAPGPSMQLIADRLLIEREAARRHLQQLVQMAARPRHLTRSD